METVHKSKEPVQEGTDQNHKEDKGQRNIIKTRSIYTRTTPAAKNTKKMKL
jgi:hypothetical protein